MTTTVAEGRVQKQRTGLRRALPLRDKVTIGVMVFFAAVAFTLEAYWLIFNQVMESRTDIFARALALYWPADYTYRIAGYPIEKCFTLAVESLNTVVMQPLSLLLIFAIVARKPYRYPLQMLVAMCMLYGTILYYYVAHLSGYAVFAYQGTYPYLMFYLANLPWAIGCSWMVYDAFRSMVERFKAAD